MGRSSELVTHRGLRAGPPDSFCEFRIEDVEQTILQRFEQQVVRHPDRIAVKTSNAVFTYDTLNGAANGVARAVTVQCGRAEEPVALLFEPGASFVAASLGVLKAGRIQVRLKSTFPRARLRYMLDQSGATALVTNETNLALARELDPPQVINIDELDHRNSPANLEPGLPPGATVAIAYTSGSTGQPKGIVWNHRGVLHAVMRHTNAYHVCVHDRMVAYGGFRAYLYALLNGATYYPVPQEEEPSDLATWMMREKITVYRAAVSTFRRFAGALPDGEQFSHLRLIQVYGEPVYRADVELYRRRFANHCVFATSLGCSEFDDYACCFIDKDTPLARAGVPGGTLLSDTEILLLDDEGRPVGIDRVGEIVIRSRYNAVGYWRRADLAHAAFLADPADRATSLYRTGDLGRVGQDGRLSHVGRKDFQVKIRGYRVEVAEVEAALLEVDGVKAAAVVGREHTVGETRLIAYMVAGAPRPAVSALRRRLAETLPDYMIPSSFMWLDALPMTPTGKVDRRALPLPDGTRPSLDMPFVAPANPLEHQLQQIWEEVLGVRPIGVADDFFDLGGHSLLAVQLMAAIETGVGRRLPVSILVEGATIQHLAKALRQEPGCNWAPVAVFNGDGSRLPFFFLHGDFEGGGLYCRNLAPALGPDQPFFALHPHGLDGRPIPDTIEAMATEHLAAVRAIQPHGPYQLGGFCSGGLIAFEMARRLQDQGEKIAFLALLDVSAENARPRNRLLRRFINSFGAVRGLSREERLAHFAEVRQHIKALNRWASERATYYMHRIPELSRIGPSDWVVLLRRTAKRNRDRFVGTFLRRTRRGARSDVPMMNSSEIDRLGQSPSAYRLAMAEYVPGRYDGTVTLFRSETYFGRRDLGWRMVAAGVEVHDIASDYVTAITRHVQILGERLRACLQSERGTR